MFDLFRFILVRPPQELGEDKSIPSDTTSEFQRGLRDAPRRLRRKSLATDFTKSARFAKGWADLTHGNAFRESWQKLQELPIPSVADAEKVITDAFDVAAKTLINRETFKNDRERAADSLVAAKLISQGDCGRLPELVAVLRLAALIERVAAEDETLKSPGAVKEALSRRIRLPSPIANSPDTREPTNARPAPEPKPDPKTKELNEKLERLGHAISALAAVPKEDYVGTPPSAYAPPRSTEAERDEVLLRLRDALAPRNARSASEGTAKIFGQRVFAPAQPATSPLALRSDAAERLPESVKSLLRERRIDVEKMSLPTAVARLEAELDETGRALATMENVRTMSVTGFGNKFMIKPDTGSFLYGQPKPQPQPALFSNIRPSGTADLLVVKQQIKRYEAGEVGHIENVLKGESNEHTVRRARTTEETQLQETETTQEEERDLQSTEHFELKTEVDKTVKEDASLKAGVSLSGSYGGMIDFKTYVDGSLSTSQEESTKQASAYSKDVTTRAATKISQRIRQQITRKTVEEFEETTKHNVDNSGGAGHVIGIYQWVDKIYEAQVWNYGIRLLFDIIVPEPAAFFINALAQQKIEGESLEKPIPFTLNPSQITETNYHIYVARYGATGIDPPPPLYRTVVKVFDERSDNPNPKTKTAELALEAGYRAETGVVLYGYAWRDNKDVDWAGDPSLTFMTGRKYSNGGFVSLDSEEGQIEIGFFGYRVSDFTATFEITTKRTDVKLDEWKLKTHGSIQQAYLKMVSDYEQKLANLKAQTAGIQGHNPARNRSIEKNELQRSALAIFTQRAYEAFDAIDEMSPGTGQPDLFTADTEGKYVRFFEQAFEWDQIMYVFYPYFWGRTSTWQQRLLLDDADPQFADFLQSGWARVTIPVRPWFEKAVAHYIETGEIWDGGDVPDINSPLYVSILTEVEERLNKPGEEKAQGDPWEVRLPTTLVRLRPDAQLPKWKKQADGTWVPEN
jgi:hypothetical protein